MIANLVYLVALVLVSPVVLYRMIRHGRYRRGLAEKFFGLSPSRAASLSAGKPVVWMHAVSVGEVNLLPRLIRQLEQRSSCRVVLSVSTDSGYDLAIRLFGSESVFFCPLDFTWAVKRTLGSLRPQQLVLTELELWPNLITAAVDTGCPVMVINGRLSQRSAQRYQQFSRLTRSSFAKLSFVGCQDDRCLQRFVDCGASPKRVRCTGSLKFDNAPDSRETPEVQSLSLWSGLDPRHRVWTVGSTQSGEEQMAMDVYQSLRHDHPELRLILVPRHQERFDEVAALVTRSGLQVHRRSTGGSLESTTWSGEQVILVDTIGELRDWWGVCQIATVGGSFGDRGGQNMLEPAGYGCAVCFGPNTTNFALIADQLVDAGGAIRVANQEELASFVARCLNDLPAADGLGRAAQRVVQMHRGATEKTVEELSGPHQVQSDAA